jgi:hypothetical protein
MVIEEGYNVGRCYMDMMERLVAFYKFVSAGHRSFVSAQKQQFLQFMWNYTIAQ